MRVVIVGMFAVALLALPAVSFSAEQAADVEKVGPSYALAMEGMT